MVHDGRPEGGHPLGMDGREKTAVFPCEDLPHQLCPGGEGEVDGVHGVGGKVVPGGGGLGWLLPALRAPGGGGSWRRRLHIGDKKAPLGLRAQIALGQKLAIGPLHRHHAHLQMGREGPLGGELFPGGEDPRLNVPPDLTVELLVEGGVQGGVQHRCDHVLPSLRSNITGPRRHSSPPVQGRAKHRP